MAFNRLGLLAFIEALIFIAILLVALAYAWRKGAQEELVMSENTSSIAAVRGLRELRSNWCSNGHQ